MIRFHSYVEVGVRGCRTMPEQLASLLPPLPTGKGTKGYRIPVGRLGSWSEAQRQSSGLGRSANAPAQSPFWKVRSCSHWTSRLPGEGMPSVNVQAKSWCPSSRAAGCAHRAICATRRGRRQSSGFPRRCDSCPGSRSAHTRRDRQARRGQGEDEGHRGRPGRSWYQCCLRAHRETQSTALAPGFMYLRHSLDRPPQPRKPG